MIHDLPEGQTQYDKEDAVAQSRAEGATSNAELGLLPRIEAHLRQLAPHTKQRDGVVLLSAAKGEIERLLREVDIEQRSQLYACRLGSEIEKQRDALRIELDQVRKQNESLRKGLIRARESLFPGTDQKSVIDREYRQ